MKRLARRRGAPAFRILIALGVTHLNGCGSKTSVPRPSAPSEARAAPDLSTPSAPVSPAAQLASPATSASGGELILIMTDGEGSQKQEHWIAAGQAISEGYTLIDFSDDWTPYLFEEQHDAQGQLLPNRYRRVFIGLGPRPEYYARHMELSIVIDRGDVWYDPPFDDQDRWHSQPRQHYPSLTPFMDYQGERVPLVRWRTTIGGWRAHQANNGYEYYRYKGSDVGARILRKIGSGPVWIAPESTPLRGLVKSKKIEGRYQTVVNYDELGPGYASAYGLVAGYLVLPGEKGKPDVDRGIRVHGSSEYLSIYSSGFDGYSHGCHRLPNHLAIRLYDFLLQHRNKLVKGDAPMDFTRQFLWKNQVYEPDSEI